ncbi:hypothetical protein B296_00019328 [Ensete ventricosum]|uniref:Uncharacterized protein n=1 Tax=Ensete ventricosum TaxID=4639 RepID=A0A426XR52_ENSVE|nr:hypothetical protein B296_00019328 [Ensete ventricosum]
MGRRCRRRTVTASVMGAGGRRQQPTIKDGRGGRLLRQGRQRRSWAVMGQQSLARATVEESNKGLAGGDSGRGWATTAEGWPTVDKERMKGEAKAVRKEGGWPWPGCIKCEQPPAGAASRKLAVGCGRDTHRKTACR